MTAVLLAQAIRKLLEDALADFAYGNPVDPSALGAPQIIDGFQPVKRSADKKDFPFVSVVPVKGHADADGESSATVQLLVGAYCEAWDGYKEALNIAQRIVNAFMDLPDRTLDRRYIFDGVSWDMPDEQPYPQWNVVLVTEWRMYANEITTEHQEDVYGSKII